MYISVQTVGQGTAEVETAGNVKTTKYVDDSTRAKTEDKTYERCYRQKGIVQTKGKGQVFLKSRDLHCLDDLGRSPVPLLSNMSLS